MKSRPTLALEFGCRFPKKARRATGGTFLPCVHSSKSGVDVWSFIAPLGGKIVVNTK